jgi:phosphatidylglycerol:prolipoprotein diacylglycerol transferase
MIDPVIFTIRLGNFEFALRWYSVLIILGVVIGELIAEREVRRRRENPEHLWEALVWGLPAGIVGARLWYVANDILGGGTRYLANPAKILATWEGGLHFYGGILFAALAFYAYARRHKVDIRLIMDACAPSLLIGQGIARLGNFINQELYGQPTGLPWGISIAAENRIPPWHDLARFPEATTRFHPTFAYEMLWNFVSAGLLLWVSRRYFKRLKPTALFAGWVILEGVGRVWIENFRPDQPRVPGTDLSYTRIVAILMAVVGIVWLLIRYEVIRLPFLPVGSSSYVYAPESDGSAEDDDQGEKQEDETEQAASQDDQSGASETGI